MIIAKMTVKKSSIEMNDIHFDTEEDMNDLYDPPDENNDDFVIYGGEDDIST